MTDQIIGLFADPWAGIADTPSRATQPLLLWRQAMQFKANPRSAAYMRDRLAESFPGARFVDVAAEPHWADMLDGVGTVVLLYPDSIGIGFGAIEHRLLRLMQGGAIRVLNGRRRMLPLDPATRRRLRLRRALERSMVVECVAGALILVATPILYGIDRARGRR